MDANVPRFIKILSWVVLSILSTTIDSRMGSVAVFLLATAFLWVPIGPRVVTWPPKFSRFEYVMIGTAIVALLVAGVAPVSPRVERGLYSLIFWIVVVGLAHSAWSFGRVMLQAYSAVREARRTLRTILENEAKTRPTL